MKKMIACCGLDCERCDAYRATVKEDDALREQVAKEWSELNGVEITKEMINCVGCRADGVKTPYCASLCPIRQCVLQQHRETCADCEKKNSCEKLSPILSTNEIARKNLEEG